jgi:hypothetical protein
MRVEKMCNNEGCVFWLRTIPMGIFDKHPSGTCLCEDGSRVCPYGRAGIEGTLLVGDEKQI